MDYFYESELYHENLAIELIKENIATHANGGDARVLNLGGCGLELLPEEIKELTWLEVLILSDSWDDYDIENSTAVLHVNRDTIGKNVIISLEGVEELVALKKLFVNGEPGDRFEDEDEEYYFSTDKRKHNILPIKDLTPLKKLTNLVVLDCSYTCVKSLEPLTNLVNLQYLDCSFTQINSIDVVKKMQKIKQLYFHSTNVTELSPLLKHENIEKIFCYSTKITDLSPLFSLIKNGLSLLLSEHEGDIRVSNCPITKPPIEVIKRGYDSILNYIEDISFKQFRYSEIKLVLVGNSTSGKTSLIRYLREKTYDPTQPSTHGIQTFHWQAPDREMQVYIWDFGGQEYYHATHRLFLSRNAVYTLVWDARTDKGGVEPTEIHYENDSKAYSVPLEHFSKIWWLNNIHFNLNKYARHEREGDVPIPVLLVQNKCAKDQHDIQSPPNEFEKPPFNLPTKWRNNHIDIESAAYEQEMGKSGEWTMRFKLFENELLRTLESQMATYEFAFYHRDIRDRVRALVSGENPVNEMSWVDFEAMCRDIELDAKMDLVEIYLRDITGDILYFDQNERLKHRVFLRPDWVCNRIYAILSRKVLEREGLFDLAWVHEALQCDEGEALDFVELMREFDLVFPDKDESGKPNGKFVAPQYLPESCRKNEYLQGLKDDQILIHAFTLWFPDFLPKSHMARFISTWGEQAEGRVFWKNGLLFKTENLKVLVEGSENFKIRVDIQTGQAVNRANSIRRVFQSFLDLEDGQAGFAVSLNEKDFVWWGDAQEAIHTQARQVKVYSPENLKFIDIKPFTVFYKPIAMAKKVFISYSHRDETAMKELDKFLGPLERKGEVEIWTDRKILPGQKWKEAIMRELESADLTLLLVSANFLDSDFINDEEIPRAFKRREEAGKHVIPIILDFCLWDITEISSLQAIPKDGRPIADYQNAAAAWNEVARAILTLINSIR